MNKEEFRAAMKSAGLELTRPIVSDGRLHRFKATPDRRANSWYVLHAGPFGFGVFGCWKRGIKETWRLHRNHLPATAVKVNHQRLQEVERELERAQNERREKARKVAAWIVSRTTPATSNPYLERKGLKVNGKVRQYRRSLVLELRDADDALHSLQFILPDGTKRFLTGGRVAGCFSILFDCPDLDLPLVICEGFATGASIHEATGFGTAVAFSSGNFIDVAKALKLKWPQRKIIIAGDNDALSNGNGIAKATEAAKLVSASLALPQFNDISSRPTDFNDLAALQGLNEVKRQIESALPQSESILETVQRLAALPKHEYEGTRKVEAKRLGFRANVLDSLVQDAAPTETESRMQGSALEIADAEPWAAPVSGADVLDELVKTFLRYIALPVEAAWTLALWCVYAHVYELFDCSPRLNISSPEKGCGKTTLRDVLAQLVPRPLATENLTVGSYSALSNRTSRRCLRTSATLG